MHRPTVLFLSTLTLLADSLLDGKSSQQMATVDAIFQSEPTVSSEYYGSLTDASSVRSSIQNQNQNPSDVGGGDSDDQHGPIVMYKHPKAQFYPRPQNNFGGYGGYRPNPPPQPFGYSYVGYINRQARRYPVMMYTLNQCVPCQRAKHLLATTYGDVPSHFLELVGNEDWQRQLQVDLLKVTRQATFPYVFVCGQFIGGSSDLFNMHHSGQLRQALNNCMSRNG